MSYQIKHSHSIHDFHSYELMAQSVLAAIENQRLNMLWYSTEACAIMLHKALSQETLTLKERLSLHVLHHLSQPRPHYLNSFIEEWVIPYFYDIIEIEEECDDLT